MNTHSMLATAAFALIAASVAPAQQYLMIPDSTTDKITLYSLADGSLVNAAFISDAGGTPYDFSTPKDAIQVGNEIWVFDQLSDQIIRFDLAGNFVAAILPATGMVDNMRGAGFANNTIYVSNDGGGNGATVDTVVMFDTAGNRLGQIDVSANNSSPFDVTEYNGELLVSEFTATNETGRYDYAGSFLGIFHASNGSTGIDSAEQISVTSNNEVLIAGFASPVGIYRYDSTGTQIAYYNSGSTSGCRGVHELANGNILFTDGTGVKLFDIVTMTASTITAGTGFQYINLLDVPPPVTVVDCQLLPTVTQTCNSVASFTGTPSATSASPFMVTFGSLNAQVNGVVFYGITGPATAVWSSESNLCVKTPTQRLNSVAGAAGNTGGVVGNCDGQYSFDMNAIIQGSGLLGTPMAAGQTVDIQAWQRDPAASKTTNLSDALSFVVGN